MPHSSGTLANTHAAKAYVRFEPGADLAKGTATPVRPLAATAQAFRPLPRSRPRAPSWGRQSHRRVWTSREIIRQYVDGLRTNAVAPTGADGWSIIRGWQFSQALDEAAETLFEALEYRPAWQLAEEAASHAPDDQRVLAQRVAVARAWLLDAPALGSDRVFLDIVERVEALWRVDIQEGFDRLRAAVSAGSADWE